MNGVELGRLLDSTVRKHDVPGMSAALVEGDTTVACSAVGLCNVASATPMSADAACNWFSMTKIATATAAMMLAERGRLDLDRS